MTNTKLKVLTDKEIIAKLRAAVGMDDGEPSQWRPAGMLLRVVKVRKNYLRIGQIVAVRRSMSPDSDNEYAIVYIDNKSGEPDSGYVEAGDVVDYMPTKMDALAVKHRRRKLDLGSQ